MYWGSFHWQGVSHIPSVPLDCFKVDAGVGHSLAMQPHLWHLKHWRDFGSCLLAVPSLLGPVPWLLWGGLSRVTSTIVGVWMIGGCTTILAPPIDSLLRATWYTRGIATLPSLGQSSHEPDYVLS